MTEDEFKIYLNAETIAYYVYQEMVKNKNNEEYVDYISNCYANLIIADEKEKVATYVETYKILKADYNIDLLDLNFKDNKLKGSVIDAIDEIKYNKNICI